MPWPSVELPQVATWSPNVGCVVGDYIVSVNANDSVPAGAVLPAGSFSVFHVPTETSRVYGGLNYNGYSRDSVVELGGAVYAKSTNYYSSGGRDLRRIDHLTGAITVLGSTGGVVSPMGVAAGGKIVYGSQSSGTVEFNTTTGVRTTLATGGSSVWGIGVGSDGHLYVSSSVGSIVEIDPVAQTVLAVYPVPGWYAYYVGVTIGTRIFWASATPTGVVFFDTATHVWGLFASGVGYLQDLVLGADGWLYGMASAGLAAVNPSTGAFVVNTFGTALTRPGRIFSAGGHIWQPYGEPIS